MRAVPEWIATNDDQAIPPRVQLRVFEKFNGICPACGRRLQPGKWACDHIIALANGGQHRESNLQPLCETPCHKSKTKQDVAIKSAGYKRRLSAAGLRKKSRMPGSRDSKFKRKLDGSVALRVSASD